MATHGHAHEAPDAELTHHEDSDVNVGPVFKFLAYLGVFALIVHGIIWVMMGYLESSTAEAQRIEYPLAVGQDRLPPEPRLQVLPREDFGAYEARERDRQQHYRWLDKGAGTVRIPIEKAMQQVLEQGLPVREGEAPK